MAGASDDESSAPLALDEVRELEAELGMSFDDMPPEAAERIKQSHQEAKRNREKRLRERKSRQHDTSVLAKCDFATAKCWEDFYSTHTGNFDWYGTPVEVLSPHLQSLGEKPSNVLHVGSGSSTWTASLVELPEIAHVTNIDINAIAIERMRQMYSNDERLEFHVMDVFNMTYADGSFDAVVDKGLMDALRSAGHEILEHAFAELVRVIRPGGLLLYISYSEAEKKGSVIGESCQLQPLTSAAGGSSGSQAGYMHTCLADFARERLRHRKESAHAQAQDEL